MVHTVKQKLTNVIAVPVKMEAPVMTCSTNTAAFVLQVIYN